MVKDFIQYTEALELKQLGFDEPCFTFYQVEYHENSPIMVDDNDQYRITGFRTCKNSEIASHYTSCPTYSQAFRWFRDNGKVVEIFSQLLPSNKYKWGFKIQGVEGITDGFFTYEEAELACLKEMIKIVKNNYGKQ
jgi:hypothetical protein